jgi:GxxExxY protein
MSKLIYPEESYLIINKCYEVYNTLGSGFLEVIYKDALAYEFDNAKIPFQREVLYDVKYKNIVLKHKFFADFVVFDKIILEIKAVSKMKDEFYTQTINYLKVSENRLALMINFGEPSLKFKRVVY